MIIYDKDKQILYIPENDDAVILGWDDIYQKGYRDGYDEGYDGAYGDAYQEGYNDGYASGIVACHVDATSITLDIPSSIVGEADAEVVVSPEDADVELIFTSSDEDIATIDENGHITVKDDGEVTFCVRDSKSGLQDCQTVSVEKPYFMVSPLSISAPASGGTYTIMITSNYPQEWSITSPGWTAISPSSGTGSGTITLTIIENDGDERNGSIVLSGSGEVLGNILVSQDKYIPFIPTVVDPSHLNVPASGGTYTIRVTSLYPWSASLDGSEWLTLSPTSGTGTGRWEEMTAIISPAGQSEYQERSTTIVVTNTIGEERSCEITQEYEEPSREIYVQTLIDEGYANVVTGAGGTYIEILPTTPYSANEILDLGEVARNEKQLTGTTNNIIVWNQELPNGWTNSDITSLYANKQLNFSPRGEMLWALGDVDNFEITFSGGGWIAVDYPWGSYQSEGVFAPRWNASKQAEYISKGFLKTPKNLTLNLTGSFSSVSQVMFTQAKSTTALTINQQAGTFACHDVTGMFEGNSALVTLNITGAFNYGTWRTQHNVFDGCTALTGIPYSTAWTRENANNTIYPHADGVRGSANCRHMFRGCTNLTYLGPTFNMGAISLSGCTYDGQNQAALTDTLFDCPALTDVRIINMNNNDWNFSDSSTFTYIPAMSAASIEYLLNNAADVNSQGGHTVTFSSLHKNEVSQSAIDAAAAKGWNVVWDGDSPTPTGSTAVAITYYIQENNTTTNITNGRTSSFSDATLDGTTPINLKSNYYTGRYTFADAGTHYIEFTPTGNSISTREFNYCLKITDVTLPEGITTIGVECFSGCKMLTGVTLCNSLTTIGAQAFMNCSAMTEIHLTSGITTIDDEAFRNCSALTGITIPSSVTTFGMEVFEGCSGLTVMEFDGTTPPTPGNALSLGNVSYTFPIYVPASSVSAYQAAYPNYASRITGISNRP